MKKLWIFSVLICGNFLFAQSSHTFNYRLDYVFPGFEGTNEEMIFAKHYIPASFSENTSNSFIHFPVGMSSLAGYSFVNGNQFLNVQNDDLENNFSITKMEYYGYGNAVETLYDKVELKKLDRAPLTVMGKTCQHYEVITTLENKPILSDFVFCIDETNEIDNVSFLLPKQEGKHIKGLLLAVTSPEGNEGERILLKSITPVNSTIQFDLEKELATYKIRQDSIHQLMETGSENWGEIADAVVEEVPYDDYYDQYMVQPKFCDYSELYQLEFENEDAFSVASTYMGSICNYSYYMKKGDEEKYKAFALKEIKGFKKNATKTGLISKKDAQMFYDFMKKDIEAMEASKPLTDEERVAMQSNAAEDLVAGAAEAVVYEEGLVYVLEYESVYKPMKPEDSDFAVTTLNETSGYWKGIPAYCKKLDTVIPSFSDEELIKHAQNYAGQICDMYLGEFEGSSVWHKGTLDAIRAEQLYFHNNRDKFSKKDKALLDEFLNNLD